MSRFSEKERNLLHQLFSPENIQHLITLFPESTEIEWQMIYGKILQGRDIDSSREGIDLILYIDGASDPRDGRAGIGGVFYLDQKEKKELFTFSENIGKATNNEAEYRALLKGLEYAKQLNGRNISILSDSELLVKQLNLEYKVKNKRLQNLYREVKKGLKSFHTWRVTHIPRNQNKIADTLSKQGVNNF